MPTAIGTYATLAAVKTRLNRSDTGDDTLIQSLCDQINGWIEFKTERPIAPYTATYTFDGSAWRTDHVLVLPRGIRSVTTLQMATQTGATLTTIPSTDYYLLPREQDRQNGWPATRLVLTDIPAVANTFGSAVRDGFGTTAINGAWGWAAIPDEIRDVAETAVVRAFHARQAGSADIIGNDETGQPLVSRFVSGYHKEILEGYRWYDGVL